MILTHNGATGDNGVLAVTAGDRSYRWSHSGTLRLYVQPSSSLAAWSSRNLELVDEAIKAWMSCENVRIELVSWPVGADVRLYWTDRLPPTNPGITMLYRNKKGQLTHADMFIDVRPAPWSTGTPDRVLYATIAHELGHAIGLPHDPSPDALMHASPLVTAVTGIDMARLADLMHTP